MHDGDCQQRDIESRWKRVRFLKKILRYMPRKASIHRYPVLNKFSDVARQRAYLWSFRVTEITPAFYLGWIITLTPIPSVLQIVIAFFAAIICRANAMILVCLQLLSNAFTFVFLWAITHRVGTFVVNLLGTENLQVVSGEHTSGILHYSERAIRGFATILLGALVLGSILGFISSTIYKYVARYYAKKGR